MAELEGETRHLSEKEADLRRQCEHQELEKYRALDAQRQKWEEREARLVGQLENLRSFSRVSSAIDKDARPVVGEEVAAVQPESLPEVQSLFIPRTVDQANISTDRHEVGELPTPQLVDDVSHSPSSLRGADWASLGTGAQGPSIEAALLAQQIPPTPKFSGDSQGSDTDSFLDWSEQFELVAEACQWTDQAKLVNLGTRLKGQAYAFY